MESLERKLGQLSIEQRRSVEDYIDFLLNRSARQPDNHTEPLPQVFLSDTAPPPLIPMTEIPFPELPASNPDLGRPSHETTHGTIRPESFHAMHEPDLPACPSSREIAPEKEDILTAGYMDYGTFEPPAQPPPAPSPAEEAVQRVRIRLGRKKKNDSTNTLLEWID